MEAEDKRIKILVSHREILRMKWRETRNERLKLKIELLDRGMTSSEAGRDRKYKSMKKEQKHYTKLIRHLDREINRVSSLKS